MNTNAVALLNWSKQNKYALCVRVYCTLYTWNDWSQPWMLESLAYYTPDQIELTREEMALSVLTISIQHPNGIRLFIWLCRKCKQINIKYMLWTCSHCALSNSIRISLRIFWQRLWATVFFLLSSLFKSIEWYEMAWNSKNNIKLQWKYGDKNLLTKIILKLPKKTYAFLTTTFLFVCRQFGI